MNQALKRAIRRDSSLTSLEMQDLIDAVGSNMLSTQREEKSIG